WLHRVRVAIVSFRTAWHPTDEFLLRDRLGVANAPLQERRKWPPRKASTGFGSSPPGSSWNRHWLLRVELHSGSSSLPQSGDLSPGHDTPTNHIILNSASTI